MLRLLFAAALAATVPFVPNDPGYASSQAQLEALSVPQAWALTRGDPAVVIAVVDTGVTPDPDLDLTEGYDNAPGTHGTSMALVAAAQIDNGIGGAGICGLCRVMPVKVSTDVDAGLAWAVDHGADVIAVTGCADPPSKAAVSAATAHGVPVFFCRNESEALPTAEIAGIAALMVTCNPALTPGELKSILRSTHELDAYYAVKRAGCRASPASIVRLMVRTRGRGTVTRRPDDDTYDMGTVVVLRAKAKPSWRFARWEGMCSGKGAVCTVRLRHSGVTTAVFKRR
jgi:hypothetical protein